MNNIPIFRNRISQVCLLLLVNLLLAQCVQAQNFLPSDAYISRQVAAKNFVQRPGTIISIDSQAITTAHAKAWLYLDETNLPTDTRLPWYQELKALTMAETCATTDSVMYPTSNAAYSSCGTMIYNSWSVNMATFNRTLISTADTLWIGDYNGYCQYTPSTSATASTPSAQAKSAVSATSTGDTTSAATKSASIQTQAAAATVVPKGPMNRCGVWGKGGSNPKGSWQHFNVHFYVPVAKQYFVGLGADNYFRLRVDGTLTADYEGDSESFKVWHIFPVTLSVGNHVVSVEAYNLNDGTGSTSAGCFGAEIYNNTAAELSAATQYSQLNIIFSTKNMVGNKICQMSN